MVFLVLDITIKECILAGSSVGAGTHYFFATPIPRFDGAYPSVHIAPILQPVVHATQRLRRRK